MSETPAREERLGETHWQPAELREARRALLSTLHKCEKALPKLRPGTAQHTLLTRRIRAIEISLALIDREMTSVAAGATQARL